MASKSSFSTNPATSPCHTIIVDDFPSTVALVRNKRREGRFCSLGSMVNRNNFSSVKGSSSKSDSSSKAKTSSTSKSSSKGKAKVDNEPLVELLVYEVVPQEFNFVANCLEWNNNINKREGRNEPIDF